MNLVIYVIRICSAREKRWTHRMASNCGAAARCIISVCRRELLKMEETALMRQHLSQSDVFIDVGANIGFYSCLARSLGKQVIAIEPLLKNLNHLYSNLIDNTWKDVEVFPVGLSDHPGLAVLYGASSTGASLISNWVGLLFGTGIAFRQRIRTLSRFNN